MGNVLGMTPLGVAGSALDFIDAKNRGDLPGAFLACGASLGDCSKTQLKICLNNPTALCAAREAAASYAAQIL